MRFGKAFRIGTHKMNLSKAAFFVSYSLILLIDSPTFTNATVCRPLSRFVVDCNMCRCSVDGREYSCTERKCPSKNNDFLIETTKGGHVVLKPKRQNVDVVLTRR